MAKEIHEQPEVVGHTLAHYIDMAAMRLKPFAWPVDPRDARQNVDRRLRHRLHGGPDRQILDRAVRAAAGRDRRRLRIPLPRDAGRSERADDRHFAVRRDGRHAGLAQIRQGARVEDGRRRQRAGFEHRARSPTPPRRRWPGPEIGVASTKAFTCQLAAMAALAIGLGRARGDDRRGDGSRAARRTGGDPRPSWPRR